MLLELFRHLNRVSHIPFHMSAHVNHIRHVPSNSLSNQSHQLKISLGVQTKGGCWIFAPATFHCGVSTCDIVGKFAGSCVQILHVDDYACACPNSGSHHSPEKLIDGDLQCFTFQIKKGDIDSADGKGSDAPFSIPLGMLAHLFPEATGI